ncbi:MAG: aminomethyl-transferring glycine dehydrogenase, partial [Nannocystaceae bacterium]
MKELLAPTDLFVPRHLGPRPEDVEEMLRTLGVDTLESLVAQAIPETIRLDKELELRDLDDARPLGEEAAVGWLRSIIKKNVLHRSLIGMGYHDCVVPPVIARNILENPGWYTQYTPYQAEISQGRLEALINFQTMVSDLTGLALSNASLLDEGTAAAEAMAMAHAVARGKKPRFLVSRRCHPQTVTVMQTRADAVGITLECVDEGGELDLDGVSGVLVQYPTTDGVVEDYGALADRVHAAGGLFVVAADLLALTLLRPPGEFGADVAIGSAQRFGVPMGFGGPHAAFFATAERFKRQIPGRIIGVSRDVKGRPAFRMAMQTREQHIRRERATSNICTAQVLLAIMAGAYAVYHGPQGLRAIAGRVRHCAESLRHVLAAHGHEVGAHELFDTVVVNPSGRTAAEVCAAAVAHGYNLRDMGDGRVGISVDERTTLCDLLEVLGCFGIDTDGLDLEAVARDHTRPLSETHLRTSEFMTHEVFHAYRSEHEMLRYLHRLQGRDLSLTRSMIALGSCTMKLNATSEMVPVSWPEFGAVHPFVPADQSEGYREMFGLLEDWLSEITGFAATSLQPNAGSQGEFTGLMVIRAYHLDRGEKDRDICLIPVSAHGTNPASAVMAGMKVVAVKCDERGNIDVEDLKDKATKHADRL